MPDSDRIVSAIRDLAGERGDTQQEIVDSLQRIDSKVHKFETGTSYCWDHSTPWEYGQRTCPRCERLVSRQSDFCCRELGPVCEECDGELEPWGGRVWHERDPEGWVGAERIEGPCPACGTTITEGDTTGLISIWD